MYACMCVCCVRGAAFVCVCVVRVGMYVFAHVRVGVLSLYRMCAFVFVCKNEEMKL